MTYLHILNLHKWHPSHRDAVLFAWSPWGRWSIQKMHSVEIVVGHIPHRVSCTEAMSLQAWFHKPFLWHTFCVYPDCWHAAEDANGDLVHLKKIHRLSGKICTYEATGFVDSNSTNSSNIGAAAGQEMLPLLFRCQQIPVIVSIQRCWAWRHGRFPHYVQRLHRWHLNFLQKDPKISVSIGVLTPKTVGCVHCVHFAWKVSVFFLWLYLLCISKVRPRCRCSAGPASFTKAPPACEQVKECMAEAAKKDGVGLFRKNESRESWCLVQSCTMAPGFYGISDNGSSCNWCASPSAYLFAA